MKNTLAITKKPHRNALATTPLVLNTVTFYSVKKAISRDQNTKETQVISYLATT